MPPVVLGDFEQLVLFAVLKLDDLAYGPSIRSAIEESTGRRIVIGSIYTTLERLEDKGLLRSRLGDATPERGGRRKRIYQATRVGMTAARTAFQAWDTMTRDLREKLAPL